jgi:hypothetical protein
MGQPRSIDVITIRANAARGQLALRHSARRRCSIANALCASMSKMIVSISSPPSVRFVRNTMDNVLTALQQGIFVRQSSSHFGTTVASLRAETRLLRRQS